jgi:predicted secreted protein
MLGINWFTALVLYVLIWWVALFAVLPFGTKPVADADAATGWRGAPENPRMGRKILWTTLIATLIWVAFLVVQSTGWISFRNGWLALPEN